MENFTNNGSTVTILKEDYIELLEYKLASLKADKSEDSILEASPWNYGIEELEATIKELKS